MRAAYFGLITSSVLFAAINAQASTSAEAFQDLLALPPQCQKIVNHQLGKLGLAPIDQLARSAGTRNATAVATTEFLKDASRLSDLREELKRAEAKQTELETDIKVFSAVHASEIARADQIGDQMWALEKPTEGFVRNLNMLNSDVAIAEKMAPFLDAATRAMVLARAAVLKAQGQGIASSGDQSLKQYESLKTELAKLPQRARLSDLKDEVHLLDYNVISELRRRIEWMDEQEKTREGRPLTHAVTIATRRDAGLEGMYESDRRLVRTNEDRRDTSLRELKERRKTWPDRPSDAILREIYDREQKKHGAVYDKLRFSTDDERVYQASSNLIRLRGERELVKVWRAGNGISSIRFQKQTRIDEVAMNSACRVIGVNAVYDHTGGGFRSIDRAPHDAKICREYGKTAMCVEYAPFF